MDGSVASLSTPPFLAFYTSDSNQGLCDTWYNGLISFTILSTLISQLYGFAAFRTYIPNGEIVPHPCNPNWVWEGVGHKVRGGGGERNPFGVDFNAQGRRWTVALCEMDSDGDGKTNGEELGDPNCEWNQGEAPLRSTGLSHPGICDPLDSEVCRGKLAPNCEEEEFKCDAINDIDVIRKEFRLPVTKVPPRETTYMCMYFDLPQDGDYHMVASTPIIDNINVMHHMLVYACPDPDSVTEELNTAQECFMGDRGCTEIIAAWAVGQNGECSHPSAGFRIGNNAKGFKRAMVELHWNNPGFVDNYIDSSGVTLYLTPNLRPYDSGVLMIGQQFLEIPPQTSGHVEESICSSRCTRQIMTDSIYVVAVQNHMHYLGRKAVSQVVVPGTRVNYLAYDQVFNYDRPITYGYSEPLKIDPGHELKLTCHFTSTSRTKTTYYGEGTNDEMCYAFITYYPKENLRESSCVSYKDVDQCEFGDPSIKGCNISVIYDPTHPDNTARYTSLMENCQIGSCRKECKPVVTEINQHPCYSGSMRTLLYESTKGVEDETQRAQIDRFWGLLRSCDGELAAEACPNPIINTDVSDSAGVLVANLIIYVIVLLAVISMV